MLYKTHLASNVVVLLSLANLTSFNPISVNALLIVGGSIVGTLAPDIDSPSSKINSILRLRKRVNIDNDPTYDHRNSPPHWPLFAFFVLFPLYFNHNFLPTHIVIGLIIGVATHLIVDMLNIRGILLFAPISSTRFRLAKIPVGSKDEESLFWLCVAACVFLAFGLLNKI